MWHDGDDGNGDLLRMVNDFLPILGKGTRKKSFAADIWGPLRTAFKAVDASVEMLSQSSHPLSQPLPQNPKWPQNPQWP